MMTEFVDKLSLLDLIPETLGNVDLILPLTFTYNLLQALNRSRQHFNASKVHLFFAVTAKSDLSLLHS